MRIILGIGLTLALLGIGSQVSEAASCQNLFSQCSARCENNPKGETKAKCTSDHCAPKLASCRKSGCWTEGQNYGGGTTCNLTK